MASAHDFDASILERVAHRPWPVPDRPWVMTQTWHDLLFAHWPVAPSAVRSRVPARFELETFDGTAWIGVVPFHMTNVAPRGVPSIPGLSAFPELNVRTYVRVDDRPGVYFFSLDAGSRTAVRAARLLLNLPYFAAAMQVDVGADGTVAYDSRRPGDTPAELRASYRPAGPGRPAGLGSLDWFLTERYCLYNLDRRGAAYRLEIHHPPWSLQPAEAAFACNTMAASSHIALPGGSPVLHFVKRQDMVAWYPAMLDH
jgi:uncharacterized protein YqjF (DUF2071 family)